MTAILKNEPIKPLFQSRFRGIEALNEPLLTYHGGEHDLTPIVHPVLRYGDLFGGGSHDVSKATEHQSGTTGMTLHILGRSEGSLTD